MVQATHLGVTYLSPGPRRGSGRRRIAAVAVVTAIALAGALIGDLAARRDNAHPVPPRSFSYFPT